MLLCSYHAIWGFIYVALHVEMKLSGMWSTTRGMLFYAGSAGHPKTYHKGAKQLPRPLHSFIYTYTTYMHELGVIHQVWWR